jgi:hypothetical protein
MPQIKLAKLAAYEKQMTSGTERDAYFVAASGHEFGRLARRASFALCEPRPRSEIHGNREPRRFGGLDCVARAVISKDSQ